MSFHEDAADFADRVMQLQSQLLDAAIRQVLVHVPSNEIGIRVDQEHQDIFVIARGQAVYVVTTRLLDDEPSVSGEWIMWPPPPQRITWQDIDISNAPMFGD